MYISGGLNPAKDNVDSHAFSYYEAVRKNKSDYYKISKNTGFSIEQVQMVKNYIFKDTHYIKDCKGYTYRRFYPSFEIAESWRRLQSKNPNDIQPHDTLLLHHELMEISLLLQYPRMTQYEAHTKAEAVYNYTLASRKFYSQFY